MSIKNHTPEPSPHQSEKRINARVASDAYMRLKVLSAVSARPMDQILEDLILHHLPPVPTDLFATA
jgi:hypothetical protein